MYSSTDGDSKALYNTAPTENSTNNNQEQKYVNLVEEESKKFRWLDWLRQEIISKDWFRIGIITFFTLCRDSAGLFSASTVVAKLPLFESPWMRFLIIFGPIIFVDCTSELVIIIFHDYRLVKKQEINWVLTRAALVGQILTSLAWLALAAYVVYNAIFLACPPEISITYCKSTGPGLTATLVVLIVWLKNSLTLKAYYDRVGVYPIICEEQYLFLYHIKNGEPWEIVNVFKKANGIKDKSTDDDKEGDDSTSTKEPEKESFFDSKLYIIGFHFLLLICFDFAALASVTNLILDEDEYWKMGLKGLGFFLIVAADIASETVILVTHDLPLVTKGKGVTYIDEFEIARYTQVICTVAWIISLGFMIWRAEEAKVICANDLCTDCSYVDYMSTCSTTFDCITGGYCNSSLCVYDAPNPECYILNNGTVYWEFNPNITFTDTNFTCTTFSQEQCLKKHASEIDCVLLGIVLLDNIYGILQLYLKSFIYPITIPESAMFTMYLNWKEKNEKYRHRLIVHAVGRMEFGRDWELDTGAPATE